jgi:hypothetical protein
MVSALPAVVSGEQCFWQFPGLTFSSGRFIDFSTAREWKSPGLKPPRLAFLPALWVCFRRFLGVLDLLKGREGMGTTISLACALAEGKVIPELPPISIMGQAQGTALELARACLDQDLHVVARAGKGMIGLGPGLTPSADDFLGGLLFAARSVYQSYPENLSWDEHQISDLLDWATTRTHPISRAILGDLALGHGPKPLHELIGGVLEGRDFDALLEAALRVAAIGHSSGWDLLAGTAMGMLMIRKIVPV